MPMQYDSISEDEAHRVLARAVELDARAMSDVSVEQLRAVAAEAGIAPEALDRALHELRAGRLSGVHRATSRRRVLARQLRHFRRHAALAIAIAVAAATPGDIFLLNALYALPLYALYELIIRLVDPRRRGGPSSLALDGDSVAKSSPSARGADPMRNVRSLSLQVKTPMLA
jgi:hypothetical protein